MKQKLLILTISIALIFIIIIIFKQIISVEPQITALAELRDVPNEKFMKEIYIEASISNAKNCIRKIEIPNLLSIDKIDKVRSKEASTSEINNSNSAKAWSIGKITFDMQGLTFEQLKECYLEDKITINIVTSKNKKLNYSYSIGELLVNKTNK
ncbi:hypothetical protein [Anaerocolumna chitinilytica]|uniref:Uncharacterized protein n=1 Tax=Anaerocolumna chitinilytica TaxID=1727145 RepID=A0A7I8DKF1_9FIRM|nr:hypothetical protein [Anaerocolumna chitinilytica]BCJ98137.1 hypothetical protein bsdcttw_11780 [Anaerocolumna chitinilytica]